MQHLFVFSLVLTLGIILGQVVDIVEIGKRRYFISNKTPYIKPLDWYQAYGYCRSIGMELLSMPNHEEATEVMNYLRKDGLSRVDFWTSGRQLQPQMFLWLSNGRVFNSSFDMWDANPRLQRKIFGGPGRELCVSLQNERWKTSNCQEERSFICQLTRCFFINYVVTSRVDTRTGNTTRTTTRTRPKQINKQRIINFPSDFIPSNKAVKTSPHRENSSSATNTDASPLSSIVMNLKSSLKHTKDPSRTSVSPHLNITSISPPTSSIPSHSPSIPSHSPSIPSHSPSIPSHYPSIPSHSPSIPSHSPSISSLSPTPSIPSPSPKPAVSDIQAPLDIFQKILNVMPSKNEIQPEVPHVSTVLLPPLRDPPGEGEKEPPEAESIAVAKSTAAGGVPNAREFSRREAFSWALADGSA